MLQWLQWYVIDKDLKSQCQHQAPAIENWQLRIPTFGLLEYCHTKSHIWDYGLSTPGAWCWHWLLDLFLHDAQTMHCDTPIPDCSRKQAWFMDSLLVSLKVMRGFILSNTQPWFCRRVPINERNSHVNSFYLNLLKGELFSGKFPTLPCSQLSLTDILRSASSQFYQSRVNWLSFPDWN